MFVIEHPYIYDPLTKKDQNEMVDLNKERKYYKCSGSHPRTRFRLTGAPGTDTTSGAPAWS